MYRQTGAPTNTVSYWSRFSTLPLMAGRASASFSAFATSVQGL